MHSISKKKPSFECQSFVNYLFFFTYLYRLQREVAAHSVTTNDAFTAALLAQHSADRAIHNHLDKIDATLARYHQQQRHSAALDVLRLQQFQGGKNKAAVVKDGTMTTRSAAGDTANSAAAKGSAGRMRNNDQPAAIKGSTSTTTTKGTAPTTGKPVVKPTPLIKPVKPAAVAPAVAPHTHSTSNTNNNTNTNTNINTNTKHRAVVSPHPSVDINAYTGANTTKLTKGRNPSKLLTDAMKNLEAVATDLPSVEDVLTSHHASNPATTSSTPTHYSTGVASGSVKTARPSPFQQTALRSLTAPSAVPPNTRGNAMMDSDQPTDNTTSTPYRLSSFRPTSHYATHQADTTQREFDSSDILNEEDDEALRVFLSSSNHSYQ